jgi:hypothetical protein
MEVYLPVEYKGIRIDCGYRIDAIVESGVVSREGTERLRALDALGASAVKHCGKFLGKQPCSS